MDNYCIISSDSHIVEPPDLWFDRIDRKFADRAPRLLEEEDGDWWYIEGEKFESIGENTQVGLRFTNPEALSSVERFANVRPGGYIPDEFVKDLAIDGIAGAVVYPSEGLSLFRVEDSELVSAIFRTYNDWIAEFCSSYPDKIKGLAMINLDDVQEGVRELERSHNLGLVGAMITVYPLENRPYDLAEYESLWSTAEELEMPLSLHLFTNRFGSTGETLGQHEFTISDYWVRVSLAKIIYSGVFERYPRLKVGAVEHELSWAPYFIEQLDFAYTQRAQRTSWHRFKDDMLPSSFFRRNVFLSFQEDARGIRDREFIGIDNLMWGSDYPHEESTFPRSMEFLEKILKDVPQKDQEKIVGGNAARIYQFGQVRETLCSPKN